MAPSNCSNVAMGRNPTARMSSLEKGGNKSYKTGGARDYEGHALAHWKRGVP